MSGLQTWGPRALWLIFAISAVYVLSVFGSDYGGCRAEGYVKLVCFGYALILGYFKLLAFIIVTVARLLILFLP